MTTPNMNLTLPDVSVTPGPTWASQINSDLTLIDQHNHTNGSGAPIPAAALDINDTLDFGNNAASGVRRIGLNPQAAPSESASLYADQNGDFFYRNSGGVPVQITSGNGIFATPGSITGLPSGTAAVTYLPGAGRYVFTKATNEAAVVDVGPLILRTGTAGSNGVVLTPHPSTTNYGLQLPSALPPAASLVGCGALGVMFFSGLGSTLSFTGTTLGVAPLGITAAQIATDAVETAKVKDGAITYAKLQASNIIAPSGIGTGNTSSTTYVGLSVPSATITAVAGRPLFIQCVSTTGEPSSSNTEAYIACSGVGNGYVRFFEATLGQFGASIVGLDNYVVPSALSAIIPSPSAGTYTFYLQGKASASTTLYYNEIKVIAYQI